MRKSPRRFTDLTKLIQIKVRPASIPSPLFVHVICTRKRPFGPHILIDIGFSGVHPYVHTIPFSPVFVSGILFPSRPVQTGPNGGGEIDAPPGIIGFLCTTPPLLPILYIRNTVA
jgi:hypothetical protein